MLDVAAVAEIMIASEDLPDPEKEAIVYLTALHDLGKIQDGFRDMIRGQPWTGYSHWQTTEILLRENKGFLRDFLQVRQLSHLLRLCAATAGHHGKPPFLPSEDMNDKLAFISDQALADAADTVAAFAELWPGASLSRLDLDRATSLSWWLPGFVTAADWIGSNTDWFPAEAATSSLNDYLALARQKAEVAVRKAGFSFPVPSPAPLFDWPRLRPMQSACRDAALPEGPMLAIIEDEAGAGKTEAALLLAQRMLCAGKARGIFFGLPTMATADAMFSRVSMSIGRMFATEPTVTLAHGRSGHSEAFRDLVTGSPNAPEDAGCTAWLADNRRRALLADVGVGTIDQALLSVLPAKFQSLRHYGLSSKILIVDEVHELGEAYISVGLQHLLRMHRMAGGSAILLTATLPLALRQKLIAIYEGTDSLDPSYPALTIVGEEGRKDFSQKTGPKGAVRVARLGDASAAVSLIAEKAALGAACVWVRNAVDDAIEAVDALRAAGVEADLLHARFTLGDRKRIEERARARFGKDGEGRAGKVLVGTQVLESSLDLDFDVMVSDLAPMAGLIQRAGRLWRHMEQRPAKQRPVAAPVLWVVSPDPARVQDSNWLTGALGKGAYVYSPDIMWRSAYHIFAQGRIVAPSGIRGLIEAAYSDRPPLPGALEGAEAEQLGKEASLRALAWQNVIAIEQGYRSGGQAQDDARYPTRLGLPQKVLVLARYVDGVLCPYCGDGDGWSMSELSANAHKLDKYDLPDQSDPLIRSATQAWPEWKRQSQTLCPVGEDGAICEGLRYSRDLGLIFGPS